MGGGDEGTRTPDPRDANAVLFQLSYIPTGPIPCGARPLERVRSLVAGYKKPKYVFVLDALPRNSLGKVLKTELRDQALEHVAASQLLKDPV